MKKHRKKTFSSDSLHAFSTKFKRSAEIGLKSLATLMKGYAPKVKQQANLLGDQVYDTILKYSPKIKKAFSEFARVYGRKSHEAFIAFRRNYEPKLKKQAVDLSHKTVDFAQKLKKKMHHKK